MKRREFFRKSAIAATGASIIVPFQSCTTNKGIVDSTSKGKRAKNIIFMVSDGMSQGTLTMGDLFLRRNEGPGSFWMNLYRDGRVSHALMDMASASSMVTDSAAASSSWGGGHRVKNGRLNVGANNEEYMPIWQKMKASGKKVGCVTTVPITHATPAGFCVVSKSRGDQNEIAEKYLHLKFDVMMGGGSKYFDHREDSRNLFDEFAKAGFTVARDKTAMEHAQFDQPLLGVFDENGLPYELDRVNDVALMAKVPSLAEMTNKAIQQMKDHSNGFCLQVEGGKVDWAAHANDAPALVYDQVAFDAAVRIAIDFAEKDGNTLVIITSDHGNSNPGLYYGDKSDAHFDSLFSFKCTNDWILMNTKRDESPAQLIEKIHHYQNYTLSQEDAIFIMSKYGDQSESGLYNSYKLPFEKYGMFQREHTSIAFGGNEHTADFTELAMFGPGSQNLKPLVKNTDLHYFMLNVAEVEDKF